MANYKIVLDKLAQPKTHLSSEDLSPNQKKHLYQVMIEHGASQGFAYDRFFKEGFLEWELRGVEKIKEDFLKAHQHELWLEPDEQGDVGYAGVLAMSDKCNFYDLIGRAKLKLKFMEYMNDLGMGNNTVLNRFGKAQEADFKEFERVGMLKIIKDFERDIGEKQIV